ncbi:MAG TPA: hypothetical protein GX507_01190 [Clostridia bacterium]|nr:hypothetical protein [Clostridia bacterium]
MVSDNHPQNGLSPGLESMILHVKDVLSCRVVRDEQGQVDKAYVLARVGRGPGAIAHDVETVLLGYGLKIDRSKISVAQVRHHAEDITAPRQIKLASLRYNYSGGRIEVEVQLRMGDETSMGKASGSATEDVRLSLSAEAIVDALRAFLPGDLMLSVDEVFCVNPKTKSIIVVTLSVLGPENYEAYISGSYVVKGDEMEAAAKATLDAVNTKLIEDDFVLNW